MKFYLKNNLQKGFTIIEMAIVVVIIAVILSGVLATQNLSDSSKTSSLISEISYYTEAKNNFLQIYEYLPGDIPKDTAPNLFGASNNAGLVSCPISLGTNLGNNEWDDNFELALVWLQLSAADMIKDKFDFSCNTETITPSVNRPLSAAYGKDGVAFTFLNTYDLAASSNNNTFYKVLRFGGNVTGLSGTATDNLLSKGLVPLKIHADIDRKIDEANTPTRGRYAVAGDGCFTGTGHTATYPSENTKVLCVGNYSDTDSYSSGGGL